MNNLQQRIDELAQAEQEAFANLMFIRGRKAELEWQVQQAALQTEPPVEPSTTEEPTSTNQGGDMKRDKRQ